MLTPKEIFRLNAATREKKAPATGAGTVVPPLKDGLDRFLENRAAFEAKSGSTITEPLAPTTEIGSIKEQGIRGATRQEVADANAGNLAPRGILKKVLNIVERHPVATTGAAVTALVGGFAAVEAAQGNIPGVHRSIENPSFDNSAKKTIVNQKNLQLVTSEQVKQQNLDTVIINKEAQTIEFVLPIGISGNTTGTIERVNLADINPNEKDPSKLPPVSPIHLQFSNIVTIVAPENAHVYLVRGIEEFGQNPNFAGSVRIYKYYKEQDVTVLWYFSDNHPTKKGYLVPLLPMQDFDKKIGRGTNYESLPVVDALTEVATTLEPNQPIALTVMAYKGKMAGPEAEIAGHDFLLKPQFKTDETGKVIGITLEK